LVWALVIMAVNQCYKFVNSEALSAWIFWGADMPKCV